MVGGFQPFHNFSSRFTATAGGVLALEDVSYRKSVQLRQEWAVGHFEQEQLEAPQVVEQSSTSWDEQLDEKEPFQTVHVPVAHGPCEADWYMLLGHVMGEW